MYDDGVDRQEEEPLVDGKYLESHHSKLELDPGSNGSQPSIGSITHGVFGTLKAQANYTDGYGALVLI